MNEETLVRIQAWIAFLILTSLFLFFRQGTNFDSVFENFPLLGFICLIIFNSLYFFLCIYSIVDILSGILIGYFLVFFFVQLT